MKSALYIVWLKFKVNLAQVDNGLVIKVTSLSLSFPVGQLELDLNLCVCYLKLCKAKERRRKRNLLFILSTLFRENSLARPFVGLQTVSSADGSR